LASDEFRCETDRFQKKYNGSNSIETTNAHDEEGERDPGEDRKRIPEMMNHKKNKTQHPTRKSGNEMASKGSNAKGNSVIGGEVPLGEKRVEIHPTTIEMCTPRYGGTVSCAGKKCVVSVALGWLVMRSLPAVISFLSGKKLCLPSFRDQFLVLKSQQSRPRGSD
jgi:hypothetical protein